MFSLIDTVVVGVALMWVTDYPISNFKLMWMQIAFERLFNLKSSHLMLCPIVQSLVTSGHLMQDFVSKWLLLVSDYHYHYSSSELTLAKY